MVARKEASESRLPAASSPTQRPRHAWSESKYRVNLYLDTDHYQELAAEAEAMNRPVSQHIQDVLRTARAASDTDLIRIPKADLEPFQAAARSAGVSLSRYVQRVLNEYQEHWVLLLPDSLRRQAHAEASRLNLLLEDWVTLTLRRALEQGGAAIPQLLRAIETQTTFLTLALQAHGLGGKAIPMETVTQLAADAERLVSEKYGEASPNRS
jgi:hypothetical protein